MFETVMLSIALFLPLDFISGKKKREKKDLIEVHQVS